MSLLNDFALGFRLAVGGGRTFRANLPRMVLTTVGIGLSVAMLLLLASATHALSERSDRIDGREPVTVGGPASLYVSSQTTPDGDRTLTATWLEAAGPDAPVPPGLAAIPQPGEMVVSPALAERIAADPLLRERFPERVVGTIAPDGLDGPDELFAYVGATGIRAASWGFAVSGFGAGAATDSASPQLIFLLVVSVVVLLIPMLVLLSAASRIGGAERERRLSTLRLAGARRGQVHRIAAGESLAGALAGGGLGLALYLAVRPVAMELEFDGITVFHSDFVPGWPLGVAAALLVPVLAIGPAWLGLRRLVVEPLAVLRNAKSERRRLWWRLVLLALGVVLLLPDKLLGVSASPGSTLPFLLAGSTFLLIGVPAVMPWFTEFVVRRIRGGSPAWQLAVRRLQLDSGTPNRVVAGVVVVLAGVITLQTMIGSTAAHANRAQIATGIAYLNVTESAEAESVRLVDGTPGVTGAYRVQRLSASLESGRPVELLVAPCPVLTHLFGVSGCADGDAYVVAGSDVQAGAPATVDGVRFVVPANAASVAPGSAVLANGAGVAVTPEVARAQQLPDGGRMIELLVTPGDHGALDRARAALGPFGWQVAVHSEDEYLGGGSDDFLSAVNSLLYTGGLLGLVIAAISLLVLLAGQLSERRRAFAAMHASGVPLPVLGRSLLWQNAIPLVFGVAVAVGEAIGTGALIVRLLSPHMVLHVDAGFIGIAAVVAVALVFAVTGAALPALRGVTRVEALRAE
ncbi:FtsX-like permease family protein [Amycolatopsis thermalba]|uniref:FtsX-like permease family protein n=1 Tax=Amycolatopsis thermalba TaxID=944492 RepID=UPI000E234BB4|nr:FtsX-like permease family protein [Amycolatopsis thermalba]